MFIIGVLFAVSVMVGSILAQWVAVAIIGMFLLALGAALLTTRKAIGFVVLTICLPLAGTGLTYDGLDNSVGVSALFLVGSAIAFLAGTRCEVPANRQAGASRAPLGDAARGRR